ncbi:MAG: NAD(P)/FAD-dependent oxidoreductase [Pseudomonadota bacterium]
MAEGNLDADNLAEDRVECVVVGAGVVGLAVASRLALQGIEVVVLERHELIGSETSSRNSEVIHAGIYYPQDSLKARLCVAGKHQLYAYCEQFAIPHHRCGKLIVATGEHQTALVRSYIQRAAANGVPDLRWLDGDEVRALEPEVAAVGGVLSPSTGVIDSHAFMLSLQGELEQYGGVVALQTPVVSITREGDQHIVLTPGFALRCRWVVNAAGLSAPHLTSTRAEPVRGYYAKGHYYAYSGAQPFSRLVYPVAEEGGLGVHVTLDLAGQVKFGPDVQWVDEPDYGFDESRFSDFVTAIKHYYPALDPQRLHPSYTGIRPKLAPAGSAFEDFRIDGPTQHGLPGRIDLLGIESPGLTASLAIADEVVKTLVSENE